MRLCAPKAPFLLLLVLLCTKIMRDKRCVHGGGCSCCLCDLFKLQQVGGRNLGKKDSRGGNYWGFVAGFGREVLGGREELEGSGPGSVAAWGN